MRLILTIFLTFFYTSAFCGQGMYPLPMVYQSGGGSGGLIGITSEPYAQNIWQTGLETGLSFIITPTTVGEVDTVKIYSSDTTGKLGACSLHSADGQTLYTKTGTASLAATGWATINLLSSYVLVNQSYLIQCASDDYNAKIGYTITAGTDYRLGIPSSWNSGNLLDPISPTSGPVTQDKTPSVYFYKR